LLLAAALVSDIFIGLESYLSIERLGVPIR
jgi:hypothetical protein